MEGRTKNNREHPESPFPDTKIRRHDKCSCGSRGVVEWPGKPKVGGMRGEKDLDEKIPVQRSCVKGKDIRFFINFIGYRK